MIRRSIVFLANPFSNVVGESPSFRAKPMRSGLLDVADSPYKETFKEYWSQPVPWGHREYGPKPKIGDPIPLRKATSMLVVAHNRHEDPGRISTGEDNDYKVLMMYRHGKGRFTQNECVLPAATLERDDWDEKWDGICRRGGLTTQYEDRSLRISAMRGLMVEDNLQVVPREHGSLAEIQGPPGPKKWHMIVNSHAKFYQHFVDMMEMPLEAIFKCLRPFRRVQTPETEMFRFDNHSYVTVIDKVPCVKYTVSVTGEKLIWVSPKEALARVNKGLMSMPTPNTILLSELNKHYPKFKDVDAIRHDNVPEVILPELCHHKNDRYSTVTFPGDMSHSKSTDKDRAEKNLRRMVYKPREYWGADTEFVERVAQTEEEAEPLVKAPIKLLEEMNEFDQLYQEVDEPVRKVKPEDEMRMRMPLPSMSFDETDLDLELTMLERDNKLMQDKAKAKALGLESGGEVDPERLRLEESNKDKMKRINFDINRQ